MNRKLFRYIPPPLITDGGEEGGGLKGGSRRGPGV